jgi:hypothetical protein
MKRLMYAFIMMLSLCHPLGAQEGDLSPAQVLAKVIQAWQKKDWTAMAQLSQPSWRQRQQDPAKLLESWFASRTLVKAEGLTVHRKTTDLAEGTGRVNLRIGTLEGGWYNLTVTLVREQGNWSFNPMFALQTTPVR